MQLLDDVERQLKQYSHKPAITLKPSHLNDVLTIGGHNHKVITIKNNTWFLDNKIKRLEKIIKEMGFKIFRLLWSINISIYYFFNFIKEYIIQDLLIM